METDGSRRRLDRSLAFRTRVLATILGCFVVIGCGPSPYNGDVTITASKDFQEPSGLMPTIQIDVIGASQLEVQRWKGYPVTDYWQVDDVLRKTVAKQSFVMTTDQLGPFVVGRWTEPYDDWKKSGVTSLILIADLPGAWQKRPADAKGEPPPGVRWYDPADDPRKLIIPWVQEAYGLFTNDVDVALQPSGFALKTPVDMSKAVPAAGD
ncbi:MAG: hypothetical protein VX672_08450 [Planctomycetota bacterium]|nr:hypothetical protein [Planctomycetota bacterium]